MISHCANPACAVPFHYLRGGRLYRFEIRSPHVPCADVPNAICARKPAHASIYFWLCQTCSAQYSLRFTTEGGTTLVPWTRLSETPPNAPVVAVRHPE